MMRMVERQFQTTIGRYDMIRKGERIVVAVSGGPDSTALLALLCDLAPEMDLDLHVAHLDHAWRGRASEKDAEFVRRMAIRRELPVTVGRISPATSSKRVGRQSSREARARVLRIRFLTEIAHQIGAQRIALGHTRDDQAESLLLRLIRGSGARGLAGIYPVVDGLLIRPLIEVRHRDILVYLKAKRLRYHIDATNRDIALTRNRVRRQLLPLLERQFNPAIVDVLAQTADLLRDEDGHLDGVAREEYGRIELERGTAVALDVDALKALPPAIRRRVLRLALTSARGDLRRITLRHVERSLELLDTRDGRGAVSLPDGCLIRREGPVLRVFRRAPGERTADGRFPGAAIGPALCPVPGEVPLAGLGLRLRARVVARDRLSVDLKSGGRDRAYLDADLMPGPLLIRGRRPGDRFVPMGGPGTRKVKSFLIDRKVNVDDRERIPLVLSGDRIAWVVGYAIDERFKVTPMTRRILVLEKEPR
jgi:tRNA(Ile)-lysidine synthase